MYAGHFAAGLAIKGGVPRAPTWGLLVGVGLPDILFGPLVLLGVERVAVTPDVSPGFALEHIDWSHSLLMSIVWSVAYGACFARHGRRVALAMGAAVFSHFLLDLPMHPPDLALWPGANVHLGLGLWRAFPTGWWFIELAVIAAGLAWYGHRARAVGTFGGRAGLVALAVLALHVANSPWLSAL